MVDVKPDSEETCRLLERIQAGEREAFEEFFARHRPFLRRLVEMRLHSRLRGRLDPSDVVQETQLDAFRQLPDFLKRQPMPFRLWLRKTVQERLRMIERQHLEASKRAVGRERPLLDGSSSYANHQLAAADPSPSQQFSQGELAHRVREATAQLPELDREILLIRTFEGLSYSEVAYILEIDPATARKRHGRALLRLYQNLTEAGLTESQIT
jgi:RNA polymerase sigma-70 factor (ECF subfamily)